MVRPHPGHTRLQRNRCLLLRLGLRHPYRRSRRCKQHNPQSNPQSTQGRHSYKLDESAASALVVSYSCHNERPQPDLSMPRLIVVQLGIRSRGTVFERIPGTSTPQGRCKGIHHCDRGVPVSCAPGVADRGPGGTHPPQAWRRRPLPALRHHALRGACRGHRGRRALCGIMGSHAGS